MKPVRVTLAVGLAVFTAGAQGNQWADHFPVPIAELSSTGANPYFVLVPGHRLVLGDRTTELVITVLDETRTVTGVVTRVVEERESEHGALIEVSRNYFAIHPPTGDVYYFGEDVDMYRRGLVVSHEGSWHAGEQGARFGLAMPGSPRVGARYYQEMAPRIAMDRARVVALDASLRLATRTASALLKIEETTPLEPGVREYKLYERGVGLVQDGSLILQRLESVRP